MPDGVLVLACGALAKELNALIALHGLPGVTVECLPAKLHNRPEEIPDRVRARLEHAVHQYDHVLVGYADCGTGGLLDLVCDEFGVTRLAGAHCYELLAGRDRFAQINADPTAFYLTDYLARHFDRLIYEGLGIKDHPQLREIYFRNYSRLVLLSQTGDAATIEAAERAAARLGLPLVIETAGYGDLERDLVSFVDAPTRRGVGVGS